MFGDVEMVVAEAREINTEVLTDRCTVTRPDVDNPGGFDPVTGETPAGSLTVHSDLPCSVREPSSGGSPTDAGEHRFQQGDAILRLDAAYASSKYDDDAIISGHLRPGDTVTFAAGDLDVFMWPKWTVMWAVSGSHMSSARFAIRKVL